MLDIKIFKNSVQDLYGANIHINGAWVKEIAGLPTIPDVLIALSENEDFLELINNIK